MCPVPGRNVSLRTSLHEHIGAYLPVHAPGGRALVRRVCFASRARAREHALLGAMAPKKKGKKGGKKQAAADSGDSPDKLTDVPRDPAAWVLEERLARMQVKVAEAEAGHTDMSGRLEQVQDDQKEIFAHLERELARKTDEVAALEARVRLLEEENRMQRSMADERLASQREAYEAEIARLKRDYNIVEADVEPGFGYPAATGEQATPQYQSQPGAMRSVDSYDAKQLLGMIVSSRPNVYRQVRTWLLDEGGAKGH